MTQSVEPFTHILSPSFPLLLYPFSLLSFLFLPASLPLSFSFPFPLSHFISFPLAVSPSLYLPSLPYLFCSLSSLHSFPPTFVPSTNGIWRQSILKSAGECEVYNSFPVYWYLSQERGRHRDFTDYMYYVAHTTIHPNMVSVYVSVPLDKNALTGCDGGTLKYIDTFG